MKALFEQRRLRFLTQCLKYLRYVLNDHFILVLLVFSGFVLYQYRELLNHFPQTTWPIWLILGLVVVFLLSLGRLASFLEPADKQFLLPKESEILQQVNRAKQRTFLIWGAVQTLVLLLFWPIYLALGLSVPVIVGLLVSLLVLKWLVVNVKAKRLLTAHGSLAWQQALAYEKQRKQAILKFFALFTRVKGVSTSVKRRAYLDNWLKKVPQSSQQVWLNLYARAFLRSGDYLTLTLRLLVLSLLVLAFVRPVLLGLGLALLLDYLLFFQLLALYYHYDYQYLTQLFPVATGQKKANLLAFLRGLGVLVFILQALLVWSVEGLVVLVLGMGLLLGLYLPYKVKQMID